MSDVPSDGCWRWVGLCEGLEALPSAQLQPSAASEIIQSPYVCFLDRYVPSKELVLLFQKIPGRLGRGEVQPDRGESPFGRGDPGVPG